MTYTTKNFIFGVAAVLLISGCASTGSMRGGYISPGDMEYIGGERYVLLPKIQDKYAFSFATDPVTRVTEISSDAVIAKILPESRIALINGVTKEFGQIIAVTKGSAVYVSPTFAAYLIKNYLKANIYETKTERTATRGAAPSIKCIVIDAGHGGKDPGALGKRGAREKHIVLDIAKRLRDELRARGGYKIIMTRDSDKFISLKERANIANKNKADLFISIHANAAKSKSAQGFEVYYLSSAMDDDARAMEASENKVIEFEDNTEDKSGYLNATLWDMMLTENRDESKELAYRVCSSSKKECILTRGVKTARFYVLKGTHMPSILVEVGYVSNANEAKNLSQVGYRQRIAEAIADGIIGHAREFERTEGFTK